MEVSADLSALEKAVSDSEKNVAALLARANELSANPPASEPADPIDTRDAISSELGVLPSPAVSAPVTVKSDDKTLNLMTVGLALVGAFVVYKIIK